MNGETVLSCRPVAHPRRSSATTPRTPAPAPQVDPRRILGNQAIARYAAATASGDFQWSPAVLQGSAGDAARIPMRAGGHGGAGAVWGADTMSMRAQAETKVASATPRPFTPATNGLLQRKCACGGAGMSGECEECGGKRRFGLQTKRKIGEVASRRRCK